MKEGETMYFPKPAINENDLAIIERGDTAEHSIEAGQYVSWKGKLGKANSAILQGATLEDSLFDYEDDGVLNKIPEIRSGRATIPACNAQSNSTVTVTFSEPMPSTDYAITVTYEGWSSGYATAALTIDTVTAKTVNGFVIGRYNTAGAQAAQSYVYWIAAEYN